MASLKPSMQQMLDGMRKFESRNEVQKTPHESKEITSKIETEPAAETKSTADANPSISEVIVVVKAYHSKVITGLRICFEETIDALEQHHIQLISTLELMHLASLPAPECQTLSEKEQTPTSGTKTTVMKKRAEASSAECSDAGPIKNLKKKERTEPSSSKTGSW